MTSKDLRKEIIKALEGNNIKNNKFKIYYDILIVSILFTLWHYKAMGVIK